MPDLSELIHRHKNRKGALLPILHDVQTEFGHIPDESIEPIAGALNLSRAEVYGVISFYHDFRTTPAGEHILKICRAEACQAMGANELINNVLSAFGLDDFGTTVDGNITIEAVYCLGLCAMSPAALLDGQPMGHIDSSKIKKAIR